MTRRGFFAGALACLCPRRAVARDERPAWVAQAWALAVPCGGGHVEGRVWFDAVDQCWEWSALRQGRDRPAGPQWRNGACKMAREAKAAAEAALEELGR